MQARRTLLTAGAFLATFAWLLLPEVKAGPASLWPSVLAVGLAFLTRDIYLALFLGALSGGLLLHGGNLWLAFQDLFVVRLLPALSDRWNLCVLVFTLMMGGLVEVLNQGGGMRELARRVMGRSSDARRAGLGAYLLGWVLFFDGLASSMLVGKTLRPVADRARLSREKLAFIVDSTSAPIAGLALVSTWVAYEMSVIRQGFENTGMAGMAEGVSPFSWLVMSLPFRFYNWFMLLLVFLLIWLDRDWGPMLEAERASRRRPAEPAGDPGPGLGGWTWARAVVPLMVLVVGVMVGLYVGGGGLAQPLTLEHLGVAMGEADAAVVFVLATAVASVVALGISGWRTPGQSAVAGGTAGAAFFRGLEQMFLPALILVFAWMLNSVIKELGTAAYLVTWLGDRVPAAWLPVLVFGLASVISFSTGTSWGTMAIVMPLVIPLAVEVTGYRLGQAPDAALVGAVGAVLAGAVFGDHCSPISDTTVVSAFSSGCDVVAHVRTQLPYALAAAGLAVIVGYAPAGHGVGPGWLLAAGGAACWAMVRWWGRPVERSDAARPGSAPGSGSGCGVRQRCECDQDARTGGAIQQERGDVESRGGPRGDL